MTDWLLPLCHLQEAGVAGDADSGTPEVASRGLSSWIQNKLEGKAGVVLNKVSGCP